MSDDDEFYKINACTVHDFEFRENFLYKHSTHMIWNVCDGVRESKGC